MSNTFGVEIEVVGVSVRDAARILVSAGINAQDEGYNHNTRPYWKSVRDGSLSTRLNGGVTAEVVSPILDVADFDQLRAVMNALKNAGAMVNDSCGTHVHVGGLNLDGDAVHAAAQFWTKHNAIIDGLVAPSRRFGGRRYSWASRLNDEELSVIRAGRFDNFDGNSRRYRSFNVGPAGRIGTVEFRQHQGTLNATKIWAWADFCQAMANYGQVNGWHESFTSLNGLFNALDGRMRSKSVDYLKQHSEVLASR